MLNSIDKNRGTHGDSSFMLGGLPSSRENPMPERGECQKKLMIASFVHDATKDDKDPWTEEALLAVAEKILKRIEISEKGKRDDENL